MYHTGLSKPDTTVGFLLATAYSSLSLYALKAFGLFQSVLVGLPVKHFQVTLSDLEVFYPSTDFPKTFRDE